MNETYRQMKAAGLTPGQMVLELLMAVAVFAVPISILWAPEIIVKYFG